MGRIDLLKTLGWSDDGTTLSANGHTVKLGNREYIDNHFWDSANVPFTDEKYVTLPFLGNGSYQVFQDSILYWSSETGVQDIQGTGVQLSIIQFVMQQETGTIQQAQGGHSPIVPALVQLVQQLSSVLAQVK